MIKFQECFEKYKKVIIFITCIILVLVVLILSLIKSNRKIKEKEDIKQVENTEIISQIIVPFSSKDCIDKNYEEIKNNLENLGFNNIVVLNKEILKYEEKDKVNTIESITINDEEIYENQEYSNNSKVVINNRVYKKCHLNIHLNFVSNLLFNKYNLIFKINNNRMGELEHGVSTDYEIDVLPGESILEFLDKDNENIGCKITLEVTGNMNISYKLNCYTDSITAQEEYVEKLDDVNENQVLISFDSKSFNYKNYEEVKKIFTDIGFTKIKTEPIYDIYWGITNEGEIAEVTIGGKKDFSRGDIFNKDDEILIKYHMKQDTSSSTVIKDSTENTKSENTNDVSVNTIEKNNNEMPLMKGTSIDVIIKKAKEYGLNEKFDEDFGHGTKNKDFSDSTGGLMLDIIYSAETKEILCGRIVTTNVVSSDSQKNFIKGMASVLAPSTSEEEVNSWINNNAGKENSIVIEGFTYETSLGPTKNALFYAGIKEWENWELSFDN